jgi:flagellar hook assembly protein FlgD
MVRTLTDSYQTAGHYSVVWDGRDDNGNDAGTGIFFYRMKSGKYTSTRKMIMMK